MRQHGHDDETLHAQRATTIAPRKSERKPEGQILDLQRKLGNSAVTQAVHSGRLPDLGVHARGLPVQREEEDDTEESDDEEAFDGAEVAGNATDDEETFDGAETNDEIEDEETLEDATEEGADEEEILADQVKVLEDKAQEAEDEGEG